MITIREDADEGVEELDEVSQEVFERAQEILKSGEEDYENIIRQVRPMESVSLSDADLRALVRRADLNLDRIEEEDEGSRMDEVSSVKEESKGGFENETEEDEVETVQVNQSLHVAKGAVIRVLSKELQMSPEVAARNRLDAKKNNKLLQSTNFMPSGGF